MYKIIVIVVPCLIFIGIAIALRAGSKSTSEIKEKISNGAKIIDVRTPEEFEQGHYTGAVNIPVGELTTRLSEVGPADKPIIVYCRSGRRSAMAKQILLDHGFTDVTDAGTIDNMPK